jgi:hypothetical protein
MPKIKLTKNKFAIVDQEDIRFLGQWKWQFLSNGYAVRTTSINGKRKAILMHRVINNTPEGMITDHINGNKIDNRKKNLRTCTYSKNLMNQRLSSRNTHGLKGITLIKKTKRWKAQIKLNGKNLNLGHFVNKEDAHTAYVKAAKKYFGEFAREK